VTLRVTPVGLWRWSVESCIPKRSVGTIIDEHSAAVILRRPA